MNFKSIYILLTVAAFLPFIAKAQTENELNKEVEVIKAYRPSISDAFKISFSPKIVDTTTFNPTFDYDLYVNPVKTSKLINELPSIGMEHKTGNKRGLGYIKAGFGNYMTPYGEVYFNSSPSDKFDFGMHFKHLSSNPGIKLNNELKQKAPYSDNSAKIFGKNLIGGSSLNWDLYFQRNAFTYYGFVGDSTNYRLMEATNGSLFNQKQVVNETGINLAFDNKTSRNDLKQTHQLHYDYLWTTTRQQNHFGEYNNQFRYDKREFSIDVKALLGYYLTSNIKNTYNNGSTHQKIQAMLTPSIIFDRELVDFSAGVNLGILADDDTSAIYHISPEVLFKFYPIKQGLTIFAGATGSIATNNYREVINENPWISPDGDYRATETPLKAFGGLNGRLGKNFSFNVDVTYSINQNYLMFVHAHDINIIPPLSFYNDFRATYDDLDILSMGTELRFFGTEKFFATLSGKYHIYYTNEVPYAWNQPDWEGNLYASYQINDRIKVATNLEAVGQRKWAAYANNDMDNLAFINYNTISPYFNWGLQGDYDINKQFSAFLKVDNILNQNFEILPGYNAHGIRFMLGATFSF